jgi:glyoxylase-like metal-dependent hydrolase (beta-lactamase superfamily II)
MELADGVYALPQTLSQGDRDVTIHPAAVETGRGVLLVDVGFGDELEQIAAALEEYGHGLGDVWGVVVTHQDGDHAGALAEVVDRTGAAVFAHPECAPYVDGRMDPIKGEGERYPAARVDVEVADGTAFDTVAGPMTVQFTPGHAPGHVSLYLPEERLLLAADALTAPTGELAGPSDQHTLEMERAIESVGELSELDVERTLCYHGGLAEQGTGAIARIWTELAE